MLIVFKCFIQIFVVGRKREASLSIFLRFKVIIL